MLSRSTSLLLAAAIGALPVGAVPIVTLTMSTSAATIPPPMLDISRQCNAMAHRNTQLMSECIVAESEARADLLQHWNKLPDASVERCMKLGAKAKRQPYVAMENCLAPDIAATAAPPEKK